MSITKKEVSDFFHNLEQKAETMIERDIAFIGKFLRSTYQAVAHDPTVIHAFQAGFSDLLAQVLTAVETHGASVLPTVVADVAKTFLHSVGKTAEDVTFHVIAGELQAAALLPTAATPEKANP